MSQTPYVVICDSLKATQYDEGVMARNDANTFRFGGSELSLSYKYGKFEMEIYINASPCEDCFNLLQKFVTKNNQVFIHVKYASFYYKNENQKSDQTSFDRVNSDGGSRLKITPFTDSDWRILNRGIVSLNNEMRE